MLADYLIHNVTKYSQYIHPHIDISRLMIDMNYLVYSLDEYMNYLIVNEMIEIFIQRKYVNLTIKEVNNVVFKTMNNVIDIDCNYIQRKHRNNIHDFIAKHIKRQPLNSQKHLIILRNFNGIMGKFQDLFKSTIEQSYINTCFIITTCDMSLIQNNIKDLLCFIRVPLLKEKQLMNLLNNVTEDNEMDDIDLKSVICQCDKDLYTCLCDIQKLHDSGESKSTFVNLFEKAIVELLEFMKKSKSLEKIIESIRITMNKLLYYSLSDNWLCTTIMKKALEIKKLKKHSCEIINAVTLCNTDLINNGKKIFAYEKLLITIYGLLHNI
jgi:hypothetical protein